MTTKAAGPDEIAQALAMREAGFTTLAISQRLGLSIRTLQRHFALNRTKKGALRDEVLSSAKAELLARLTNDEVIKEEASRLIADDIAHAAHLREVILHASEHMKAANLPDAVKVMRAAAAYSTALKNTSDIIRKNLGFDRISEEAATELPELFICELTECEVLQMRAASREDGSDAEDEDSTLAKDDEIVAE